MYHTLIIILHLYSLLPIPFLDILHFGFLMGMYNLNNHFFRIKNTQWEFFQLTLPTNLSRSVLGFTNIILLFLSNLLPCLSRAWFYWPSNKLNDF